LVVPEADAGRLTGLDCGPSGRALAVVVVEAVDSLPELHEELVLNYHAAPGCADTVDPLQVADWLRLGEVVAAWPKVGEQVGAVGVGRLRQVDGLIKVVGASQGDRHAGDAPLAEVDLAVVVE